MVTTPPKVQSHIIKRPRLTKLLDESEARIILLCAPAGYGKTTLAREWVETLEGPSAWYSSNEVMGDVAAIATGMAALLTQPERARKDTVSRVASLAADGASPKELAARVAAVSEANKWSIVVIDDYHLASSREVDAFLGALVVTTSQRYLITSRTRPDWISARMQVYGRALVVSRSDMAFTEAEGAEVLADRPVEEARSLLRQAEGWPALIGLAATRGRLTNPTSGLIPSDLYRFFADDLHRSAGDGLRSLLFWIALIGARHVRLLPELPTATVDGLVDTAATEGWLVTTPDGLAIHPLLRTFLLAKLRESPQARVSEMVQEAVRLLQGERAWEETLALLEEFPERTLIVPALMNALDDLLSSGRIATIQRWAHLARREHAVDPLLLIAEAEVALRQREEVRAQALAERAAALLSAGDYAARAHLIAARAAHLREDAAGAARNSERGTALAEGVQTRHDALWIGFLRAMEDQKPETVKLLETLEALPRTDDSHVLRIAAARALVALEVNCDVRTSVAISCEAAPLLTELADPLTHTNFLNTQISGLLMSAAYEDALRLTDRQVEIATSQGLEFAVDHALVARARAFVGLRRLTDAAVTVRDLHKRGESASEFIQLASLLNEAKLRIARGDLLQAQAILTLDPSRSISPAMKGEFVGHRALVLAALGDIDAAEDAAQKALAHSQHIEARAFARLARAVIAAQSHTGTDVQRAPLELDAVLEYGHLDAVITACRAYPSLARIGATSEERAQLVTSALLRSHDADIGQKNGLNVPRELRRTERLSARELDVYELILQGLTNRQIAKTLFISESTTKVHVRHIFEKLRVRSRAEAAALLADSRSLGERLGREG